MAKLFGVIPYGGDTMVGQLVKDVGHVSEGFMSQAMSSKAAEDTREAKIADAVTEATLKSAVNLDSKYPLFKAAEKEKLDKYKLLRDDPSIGPEKAKWMYAQPGFLEQENWLTEAYRWSEANPNYTKYTGNIVPEEQYQKNITNFKNQVKGRFGNNHGDNMSNLFVGQADAPQQTDTPSIDTTMQTGDTAAVQAGATDQTQAVGMVPPGEKRTVSQQKDRIWSIALAAADVGITGDALVQSGLLNPAELAVWNQTTGVTDFRLEALKIVKDGNIDLFMGVLNQDPKAVQEASGKISALTNLYYNQIYVPIINQQGGNAQGHTPVTIDNKTYVPATRDGAVTATPDTNEVIYGLSGDESGTFYIYRNGVFLKAKHENGKTIVEGDKDFKSKTNILGIPEGVNPFLQ